MKNENIKVSEDILNFKLEVKFLDAKTTSKAALEAINSIAIKDGQKYKLNGLWRSSKGFGTKIKCSRSHTKVERPVSQIRRHKVNIGTGCKVYFSLRFTLIEDGSCLIEFANYNNVVHNHICDFTGTEKKTKSPRASIRVSRIPTLVDILPRLDESSLLSFSSTTLVQPPRVNESETQQTEQESSPKLNPIDEIFEKYEILLEESSKRVGLSTLELAGLLFQKTNFKRALKRKQNSSSDSVSNEQGKKKKLLENQPIW